MKRNYTIQDKFLCKFKSIHLLRIPRKLPCGKTLCLECIEILASSTKSFKCPFCTRIHVMSRDLKRNMLLEHSFSDELDIICNCTKSQLDDHCRKLIQTNSDRLEIQNNIFEFIQNDIDVRIESLKISLDKLQNELDLKQDKFKIALNEKFKCIQNEFNIKMSRINMNMLEKFQTTSKTRYQIKSLIGTTSKKSPLDMCSNKFIGILSQPSFNQFNLTKFTDLNYRPEFFSIDFNAVDLSEYTNGKYLCVDANNDNLLILNKNFRLVERLDSIDNKKLFRPTQIVYDEENEIVLVCIDAFKNSFKREILVSDKNFKFILYTIDETIHELIRKPTCIHLEKHNVLYILDFSTRNLVLFNVKTKDLIKTLSVFQDKSPGYNFDQAYSVSFIQELLAINFKKDEVHLYSTETGLLQSIVKSPSDDISIYSIYLSQNGLFMHFNDFYTDEFVFFEKNSNNSEKITYLQKYSIAISEDGRLKGSNRIKQFEEKLVIILWGKELVFI